LTKDDFYATLSKVIFANNQELPIFRGKEDSVDIFREIVKALCVACDPNYTHLGIANPERPWAIDADEARVVCEYVQCMAFGRRGERKSPFVAELSEAVSERSHGCLKVESANYQEFKLRVKGECHYLALVHAYSGSRTRFIIGACSTPLLYDR